MVKDLRNGIELKMNIGASTMRYGSSEELAKGEDENFVSIIDFIAPLSPGQMRDGVYQVEYKGDTVEIHISTLHSSEHDPLYHEGHDLKFGTDVAGLPLLPYIAYSDNRGRYPCVLVSLFFPKRISTWVKEPFGENIDYEAAQVTGFPDNAEKILALVVLNRLLKAEAVADKTNIKYEEVTVFLERYFDKVRNKPVHKSFTALDGKDAYKNAVYEYLLPRAKESELASSIAAFQKHGSASPINDEAELMKAVETVIDDVLIHHIHNRRWIEPFWDSERKTTVDGKEIYLPRIPKVETKIQPTLHVIFDMALTPLGIQVIRESDEGIGKIDFRFLFTTQHGKPLSVGVEFKLAHHGEIGKGIKNQLPAYLKAIRSTCGIFVVMWFKDEESKFFKEPRKYNKLGMDTWLSNEAVSVSTNNSMNISSRLLDVSVKQSASIVRS